MNDPEVQEALRNLILGTGVKRGAHCLVIDDIDATSLFTQLLIEEDFQPSQVDEINLEPGERAPAFYLDKGIAHFGWVFWEVFFPGRMRKIFGSVMRNQKGDWAIILGRKQQVYANVSLREEMDLVHPSEF